MFSRKQIQADRCICFVAKSTGKPYEGKPHVRFDEKMLEIGYGCNSVTLSEETERNGKHKPQPVATTPVFYSTLRDNRKGEKQESGGKGSGCREKGDSGQFSGGRKKTGCK